MSTTRKNCNAKHLRPASRARTGKSPYFGAEGALAKILIKESHYGEAETLARKAFESEIRTAGPLHSATLYALLQLVAALTSNTYA